MSSQTTEREQMETPGRDVHDLSAWHRSLSPRECLYVAFELSQVGDELARKGAELPAE